MIKVSIIVPIYNVERYLSLCLDSLRAQTYHDLEIICVNDGSKDRSAQILALYEKVDPRVKVVEKPNGGLSSARNAGILAATGDVVCFVDSDDMLKRNAVSRIAEVFEGTLADVVTFGAETYPLHYRDPWLQGVLTTRDAEYDEFTPDLFVEESAEPFAWRTACRRDFLIDNNILFDEEIRYGEDKLFQYSVYPRSNKTVFISDRLYVYRVGRVGSLMDSRSDDPILRIYDHIRIVERISRDWNQGGFIDEYGLDLLLQFAKFILVDVLMSPYEWRNILMNYLQAVWTTYFPASQLEEFTCDSEFGGMAKAILFDRRMAYGWGRRKLFYVHTLRTHPSDFIVNLWHRVLNIKPIRSIRVGIMSRLPMSSRVELARYEDLTWKVSDDCLLGDSLKLLQIEMNSISRD